MQDKNSSNHVRYFIHLQNNPIQCDCELFNLLEYLDRTKHQDVKVINFDNFSCNYLDSYSKSKTSKKITDFNSATYTCRSEFLNLKSSNICGIYGMCDCRNRPYDQTLLINCSYRDLSHFPDIKWNLNSSNIELYLQNSRIKKIPNFQELSYDRIRILDLSDNLIKQSDDKLLIYNIEVRNR